MTDHHAELARAHEEIERLSRELDETNRGVLALYAELDERAMYLERVSNLKTRFLSDLSHELRTPLNSVLNVSRLLLDGYEGPLTERQQHAIRLIQRSTGSLLELVSDWLDLAKIEAGKVDVRPSDFTIDELFGALRGVFRPLATSDAVALIFEPASELPPLHTDETKVAQILRNFISNALKFTEHGEVRVSAAAGPHDTIVVTVADTGIGIAPEDQERIFDEFTQVEHPRQRRVTGTGLGLPLSRRLARLLGGDVLLRSTPGVGSTFILHVPRHLPAPPSAAESMRPAMEGAPPRAGAAHRPEPTPPPL